jgi:hypothetical protein
VEWLPLTEYTANQLGAGVSVDGPCLMRDGTFALFVSLRGKDGGAMPSPAELHWGRDVPDRMRAEPTHLFLRKARDERSATYLGRVAYVKTGRPARDGFKVLFRFVEPLPESTWRELVASAQAPAPAAPEEAIAALTTESTTADRVHALRSFVERWYGAEAETNEATSLEIPPPLRELHRLASTRKLFGQNRLVPAKELVVEDGKMVFYVENQGVCLWAIDPTLDDPPVFVRSSETESWALEAPTLSGFLIQAVLFETILCAPYFGASTDAADAAELRKIRRRVAPLVLPPWARNKTEFFASSGIIGFAYANGDAHHIELAAHDREPFEALEGVIDDWPNIGF